MLQIRGALPGEMGAVASCIAAAFSEDSAYRAQMAHAFKRSLATDPQIAAAQTRVAVDNGQVIGAIHIADRRILLDNVPLRVAFVPWMGTQPVHQGRGYGSLLLMDALNFMLENGYDLSLIPGKGAEPFYERAGWSKFKHAYYARMKLPEHVALPRTGLTVRSIDWNLDLDSIMAIHDQHEQQATGFSMWTRDFWSEYSRFWAEDHTLDYPLFYVATRNNQLVAYLRNGFRRAILEVGMQAGAEDAALTLILHACQKARQAGLREIYAVDLAPFSHQLAAAGITTTHQESSGYLYRILDLRAIIEKLVPRFQLRWQQSPVAEWEGTIQITSQTANTYIRIRNGRVLIPPYDASPAIRLHLTHAQTVDLLFGQANLAHYWIETHHIARTTSEVLNTLFPAREYRHNPTDIL